MSTRYRPKTACVCCGKVGIHSARGLIGTCYARYKYRGTLDEFQLLGHKNRKPAVGPDETVIPLAVLGALLAEVSPELEERIECELGVDVVTLAINAAEAVELAAMA
jgi:hypothetical protein